METIELAAYLAPLKRWWWLVAASTLLAALSSAYVTYTQPPLYQSATTIMLGSMINEPNPDSSQIWLAEELLNMYADMINRQSVREGTMKALGLPGLPGYTTRIVPNTQFMEISVLDSEPARAQAVAVELVNQLILRSPAGSEQQDRQLFVYQQLDEMEQDIDATKDEITKRESELGRLLSARQIADSQYELAALGQKLGTLQANYAALLATTQRGAVNTINVIETANLPTTPISAGILYNLLLAGAIGFVLGAGAAYVLEYLDDTVKNTDDIQKVTGVSTLGAVPELTGQDKKAGELIMVASAQSPAAEAYRILRTNLQFASIDEPVRTLLVTSPDAHEGKSITAANLAVALAQSGKRVVLLDCDMHRPRQHRLFNLANTVGVTSSLLHEAGSAAPYLQPTEIPNLTVMTTGPLPPNSAELLGSQRLHMLLERLRSQADYLILDSPPVLALSDAPVLATQADGVMLVVAAGKTRRDTLKRAQAVLHQVNARVVGVLLNRLPRRGSGYYYSYYYPVRHKDGYYRRADAGPVPSLPASPLRTNGHGSAEEFRASQPLPHA